MVPNPGSEQARALGLGELIRVCDTEFSRERMAWRSSNGSVIEARLAIDDGRYMRLATPIEDELLNRIAVLEAESRHG